MKRFYRNFVPLAVAIPCWFYYANMTFRPLVSVGASLPPAQVAQFFAETPESASNPFDVFQVYWKPSATDYTTNAGLTTLTDLRSGTYPLTNTTAAGAATRIEAGIDGEDYLNFDGASDYLRTILLTNAQPSEVWAVMSFYGDNTTLACWYDSHNAGVAAAYINSGNVAMNSGAALNSFNTLSITNRWLLYRWRWDGASSFLHTNGVQMVAGNAGSNSRDGMTVGMLRDLSFPSKIQLAWMGVINSNLTSATEANSVSNALKTLFPTAIP